MYDETGRIMRDNFWREDMSGVDWDAVLDRYRPVLDRVATHDDLVDLLWEVHGELGTSHAYVTPAAATATANARVSSAPTSPVTRTAVGASTASSLGDLRPARPSPLAAPGVAVRTGDAILAVAGQPVDPVTGPAPSWWARQANPSS